MLVLNAHVWRGHVFRSKWGGSVWRGVSGIVRTSRRERKCNGGEKARSVEMSG